MKQQTLPKNISSMTPWISTNVVLQILMIARDTVITETQFYNLAAYQEYFLTTTSKFGPYFP
jgi:hypothetical protein